MWHHWSFTCQASSNTLKQPLGKWCWWGIELFCLFQCSFVVLSFGFPLMVHCHYWLAVWWPTQILKYTKKDFISHLHSAEQTNLFTLLSSFCLYSVFNEYCQRESSVLGFHFFLAFVGCGCHRKHMSWNSVLWVVFPSSEEGMNVTGE